MNSAFRSDHATVMPIAHRSIGTIAAALATCTHPKSRQVLVAGPAEGTEDTWCAGCGALRTHGGTVLWQSPALTSQLTRRPFEELVLVLHAVVQLTQLAGAQGSEASALPAPMLLRQVRASLAALARLPPVRDVDRLEEAIAAMRIVHQ
jgi:hypothetical protein